MTEVDQKDAVTALTAITAGEKVLRHFWDLASLEESTRVQAAISLVEDLLTSQQEQNASKTSTLQKQNGEASKTVEEEILENDMKDCSALVVYSLRRLVRGLGSGRQAARQGFALCLTILLSRLQAVTCHGVLRLLELYLQPGSSKKGADARDGSLGCIFGYSAIIRSGRASNDFDLATKLAAALLGLSQRKSFLAEVSAASLLDLLEQLDNVHFKLIIGSLPGLVDMLHSSAESATPEALFLALRLWGRLDSEAIATSTLLPSGATPPPAAFFTDSKPDAGAHPANAAEAFFTPHHLQKILGPLRLSSASHPRLHLIWPTLLALLIPGFTPAKVSTDEAVVKGVPNAGHLETFWQVVVEEGLFTSSHERKYLGFQLFTLLLPYLGQDQVPAVISPRFQQTLVNSLAQSDRLLHTAARKVVVRMTAFAQSASSPALRVSLALALQRHGTGNFDRLTRTKTVFHLLQSMDSNSIRLYIKHLKGVFASPMGTDAETSDNQNEVDEEDMDEVDNSPSSALEQKRGWVIAQLGGACNLADISEASTQDVLQFLIIHAFFEVDAAMVKSKALKSAAKAQPPPSEATRKQCAARLMTVLEKAGKTHKRVERSQPEAAKSAQALPGPPGMALGGTESNGQEGSGRLDGKVLPAGKAKTTQHERRGENLLLKEAVEYARTLQASKGVALVVELSEPIRTAVTTLHGLELKAASKLLKVEDDQGKGDRKEQLLSFLQLVRWLQLYIVGDAENAEPELAEELSEVYKAAFAKGKKKTGEDGSPSFMDRFIDIVLSLLAYSSAELPSAPLREAIEALFRCFASQLTQTGLRDLVRVITRADQPTQGEENEVLDDDEDEEEEEIAEEDADGDEDDGESESDDPDTKMAQEIGPEAGPEDLTERPAGMEIDNGVTSTSGHESEDEDMTDEQMFKMDKLLAAVLRIKKDNKDKAKNTRQAMQNFKLRTLALLDLYSKTEPNSAAVVSILVDLLKALEVSTRPGAAKGLSERLKGVILKLCRNKPDQTMAQTVSAELLASTAVAIHRLAGRSAAGSLFMRSASEAALHYILSITAAAGTAEHRFAAVAIGKKVLDDFFLRRDLKVTQQLVADIACKQPDLASALLPDLARHMGSARTAYLQTQAASLIPMLLKHLDSQALSTIMQQLLHLLTASSAVLVQGDSFTGASKHADALKHLAIAWEGLRKLLPNGLAAVMQEADKKLICNACTAASATAASPKVFVALVRICKALDGPELEQPDSESPKKEYRKAVEAPLQNGRAALQIQLPRNTSKPVADARKDSLKPQITQGASKMEKKRKAAKGDKGNKDVLKDVKQPGKKQAAGRTKPDEEPAVVVVDELNLEQVASKPKKQKKAKKAKDKKEA